MNRRILASGPDSGWSWAASMPSGGLLSRSPQENRFEASLLDASARGTASVTLGFLYRLPLGS